MLNVHRSARRTLAVTAALSACLAPLAVTPAAGAATTPISSSTIQHPEAGCPVPGTGTVRPCLQYIVPPPAPLP
jgi:hypothetical protein